MPGGYFGKFGELLSETEFRFADDITGAERAPLYRGPQGGGKPGYGLQFASFGLRRGDRGHERARIGVFRVLKQLFGRCTFNDAARIHDLNTVSVSAHYAQIMSDENDGGSQFLLAGMQQV